MGTKNFENAKKRTDLELAKTRNSPELKARIKQDFCTKYNIKPEDYDKSAQATKE